MIKDKESLISYLNKGKIYSHDILSIMVVLRNEIAERSLQSSFKNLNLFCNWAVHSQISSSNVVIDIMTTFIETILTYDWEKEMVKFNDNLFSNLRNELIDLFKLIGVNSDFLNDDIAFTKILNYLLTIIHERPLHIPKTETTRGNLVERINRLNELVKRLYNEDYKIESLSVVDLMDGKLFWNLGTNVNIDTCLPIGFRKNALKLSNH